MFMRNKKVRKGIVQAPTMGAFQTLNLNELLCSTLGFHDSKPVITVLQNGLAIGAVTSVITHI